MDIRYPFLPAFEAFAEQFGAQLANSGVPSSEHAVHFSLALGFQAAYNFTPGSIVFEWPVERSRVDLRIVPLDLVIEVKFRRPIPSGRNLPATQLFGDLLADFNKLSSVTAEHRMVVFVSDGQGFRYLQRSGRDLLPVRVSNPVAITAKEIARLPQTAARRAVADGPWQPLKSELIWARSVGPWYLLSWNVFLGESGITQSSSLRL